VSAFEGESRLAGMVESFPVETRDLGVNSRMFDVARDAPAAGIAVDTLPRGDPRGDRRVTGEAFRGGDLLAGLVALLAVVETLEAGVGFGERSGGDEPADLLRGRGVRTGQGGETRENEEAEGGRGARSSEAAIHQGTIA
jgi:hypothetical protein